MPNVRRGHMGDMQEILRLMEDHHETSNLKDVPFNRRDSAQVLEYYIRSRDSVALVVEKEGKLLGLLVGSLEPFFFNKKKSYASDLMFISNGYGAILLREFKKWAWAVGADRIIMGVSSGEPRADAFLEVSGFTKTGGMYVLCKESG